MRAIWNGATIAESDDVVELEGNAYFPMAAVRPGVLQPSAHTSACPWKGIAHYYSVQVGDALNTNAAWYYPEPKQAAGAIRGRIAFWKGVRVTS